MHKKLTIGLMIDSIPHPEPSTECLKVLDHIPIYTPKQETILQGAVRVFLQRGYAGTSMDRVASEAGVSKQTIRRFQAVFHTATLQGEPEVLLRQFAETYLNKIVDEEYVALFRVIFAESLRFPELAKLYGRTVIQQGQHLVSDYFRRHPELGFTDPEAIAQIFVGALVSYVIAQEIFYGKETIPLSRDRLIESLLTLTLSQAISDDEDQPPKD
jgi:AcrR family transcriptional regulator